MSLSVFLLTGISASSFSLVSFLTATIETNKHTAAQLNFAIAHDNSAALYYAWQQSKQGSQNWQMLAKKLANTDGEVAYLLANFYLTSPNIVKAHPNKENSPQLNQAMLWFQQAIRLNYPQASLALAKWYFQQGNVLVAQKLLTNLQKIDHLLLDDDVTLAVIILRIKVAISVGDIELTQALQNKFSSQLQADEIGNSLLDTIEKYQVIPSIGKLANTANIASAICPNSIQLFATNVAHLKQLEQLIKRFKLQSLNKFVCFTPVRYIAMADLSCSSKGEGVILCDESKFDQLANTVATRYIGLMLPEGGANVHLGLLYFDAQDSIDVFEHEVSHLLGFIDEYPLAKGHEKCLASQKQISAQNIAVLEQRYFGERKAIRAKILTQLAWAKQIKKSTPILQLKDESSPNNKQWLLGTPKQFSGEVGVFKASTCDKSRNGQHNHFTAYKPLLARTKLEYNTLEFPTEYIKRLHQSSQQLLMPSFHYNIALAYFQQNKIEQANYWLERAALWESNESRKEKVLRGSF